MPKLRSNKRENYALISKNSWLELAPEFVSTGSPNNIWFHKSTLNTMNLKKSNFEPNFIKNG